MTSPADHTATERPQDLPGLHHVTAIASDPRVNLDFYTRVLGQRLVKKTVNFDDPGTYHLYYGDGEGTPGSIMTFFPWPSARPGRVGAGQVSVTAYAVPLGSTDWWSERLGRFGVAVEPTERFDQTVLSFADPDGLRLELVETEGVDHLEAWVPPSEDASSFDADHAIRGFFGITLASRPGSGTRAFLEDVMAFRPTREDPEEARTRYLLGGEEESPLGGVVDLLETAEPGASGAGTVHHVAYRIPDDEAELRWLSFLRGRGAQVSPVMDRQYFRSIYFREPGGVLFEIATDPPGFTIDEPVESLGLELKLPPALESDRARIEGTLPPL